MLISLHEVLDVLLVHLSVLTTLLASHFLLLLLHDQDVEMYYKKERLLFKCALFASIKDFRSLKCVTILASLA